MIIYHHFSEANRLGCDVNLVSLLNYKIKALDILARSHIGKSTYRKIVARSSNKIGIGIKINGLLS